jgi:endoglucanase
MTGGEGVGSVLRAVTAVVLVTLLASACSHTPDRRLRPWPPAVRYAPLEHPFRGTELFVDTGTAAARWQRQHGTRWLDPITIRPQARWLTSPQDLAVVPALARQARRQDAMLVLVAYYVPNRGCTSRQGAHSAQEYARWTDRLVHNLSTTRAVVIMEPDAVPADCFDAGRAAVLRRAVKRLAAAGQYVYVDAGHARWRSSGEMAERLLRAGIQYAQGFSVNVANRQTTRDSQRWGQELSDLVGNREFVIDTSRNGLGPPPNDPSRDDEWCNPEPQALGQPPTTRTTVRGLGALLWIKPPGESDGICGGERGYTFSPKQAGNLIANSPWVSPAFRRLAPGGPVPA